ncbi:MAG: tetratricopeptide repeat protein, partial [Frankia sp.]|nr:tetratricopeptide repeat protein [Frankia sp.]
PPLRQAADYADPRVRASAVAGLLTLLDDRELLDLAHRLRAAGRLAEAEPALRRLVNSADPDHARIGASVLGAVLYDLGRIDEAEAAWRLAVQRRDPAAAMGLADLLARRGQHAEALELYHRLRQLDPAAQTDFGLFIRDRIDQLLRYQNP